MMKCLRQSVPVFAVALATPFPDVMILDVIYDEELCSVVLSFHISAMSFD